MCGISARHNLPIFRPARYVAFAFDFSKATWPQGRPDLEPVSVDRCTPAVVEGQPQPAPMLATAYKTGQVEVFR